MGIHCNKYVGVQIRRLPTAPGPLSIGEFPKATHCTELGKDWLGQQADEVPATPDAGLVVSTDVVAMIPIRALSP